MCDCKVVNEYVHMGKCKHNHENRIVLPSGAMVPWLNPNQQGTVQMLCEVTSTVTVTMLIQAEAEPSKQNKVTQFKPELGQPGVYAYRKQSLSRARRRKLHPCTL
jgi:hypothetical protein